MRILIQDFCFPFSDAYLVVCHQFKNTLKNPIELLYHFKSRSASVQYSGLLVSNFAVERLLIQAQKFEIYLTWFLSSVKVSLALMLQR